VKIANILSRKQAAIAFSNFKSQKRCKKNFKKQDPKKLKIKTDHVFG